jgi:pimeloyl-ACP methyl ester carboxylesterase
MAIECIRLRRCRLRAGLTRRAASKLLAATLVNDNVKWLSQSTVPRLFILGDPGMVITEPAREFCRRWINQREVTVKGIHFLQEDSPDQIGTALAEFLESAGG